MYLNTQNFQDSVSALIYPEEGGGMLFTIFTTFVSTLAMMGKAYFNIKMPRNYHIKWKIRAWERLYDDSLFCFFLMWASFKVLLNLLPYCSCFMFGVLTSRHVGSELLSRVWAYAPCSGRRSLNHRTSREILGWFTHPSPWMESEGKMAPEM